MKIQTFKSHGAQAPEMPLHHNPGQAKRKAFRRWLIVVSILLSPFVLSAGLALSKIFVIGADGRVETSERDLLALSEGVLSNWNLEEGQMLRVGDTLGRIEHPKWREEYLQNLSQIERIDTSFRSAQLQALRRAVAVAEANQSEMEQHVRTLQQYYREKTATLEEVQNAQNALQQSRIRSAEITERMLALESDVRSALAKAKTQGERRQLIEDLWQSRQRNAWIIAQDSGTWLKSAVHQGDYIRAGQNLGRLSQKSRVILKAYLPTKAIDLIQHGQVAEVTFPDQRKAVAMIQGSPWVETTSSEEDVKLAVRLVMLDPMPETLQLHGLPFKMRLYWWEPELTDAQKAKRVEWMAKASESL